MAGAREEKSSSDGGVGYVCNFVDESPDGLFKCRICALVLRDPHLTECCGENACHLCIVNEAENGRPCPIPGCRNKRVKINLNRDLRSIILESDVYCQSKEAGCGWMGKLDELDKHFKNECPYAEEECQHHCGVSIQRRFIKDHERVCKRLPIECNQCGKVYKRHCHSIHVKVCPFTVVKCPFNIVGCKSEVQNKDLQQHFNKAISEHYALVAKQSQDVQTQVQETKLIVTQQKREKLDYCVTEADKINDKLTAAQEKVAELQKKLKEANHRHEELKRRQDRVKIELQSLVHQQTTTFQIIRKDLDRLVGESRVKCYGPPLPNLHPIDIVSRPQHSPISTDESIPPVTFIIPNFNVERRNDAQICLPPFYTHSRGYKLCMIVYCNGLDAARDKWLSVYVSTLKGRYDDSLRWPLTCTVQYRIVTATNRYMRTIKADTHARVLEDSCFSSLSCTTTQCINQYRFYSVYTGQCTHVQCTNQYSVGLSELKHLENGCLLMQVDSVSFK